MSRQEQNQNSFAEKWSPQVAKKGFAQIPNCLIYCQYNLGITNDELKTLIFLIAMQFGGNNPYPSVATIAKASRQSSTTIRRHLRDLESKGIIKRIFRKGTSNEYNFLPLIQKMAVHKCTNPIQIRTEGYPKVNKQPYSNSVTKQEVLRRSTNNISSVGEILNNQTRGP